MKIEQVIEDLELMSNGKYKNNVTKMGIPQNNSIGVSTPLIRKYAKKMKKDKEFALDLWNSDIHELKMLATLVFPIGSLTKLELDYLANNIYSWDLCDQFCKEVVAKSSTLSDCINS